MALLDLPAILGHPAVQTLLMLLLLLVMFGVILFLSVILQSFRIQRLRRRALERAGLPLPKSDYPTFDLFQVPGVKWLLRQRYAHFLIMYGSFAFFIVVILTGIFGTPVGNRNFSIIFVWIVWWVALMLLLVPFAARGWCATCPIPGPGEWLQRRSITGTGKGTRKGLTLGKKWPAKLRNIWPQNIGFLGIALFSAIITTTPVVTGFMLLGLILAAIAVMLVFERRAFCRYLCPVGGFLGLYSMTSAMELRSKSKSVCATDKSKACAVGCPAVSYECPWFEFAQNMERNAYCGLCFECIKGCPKDNIALNLRPFAGDDLIKGPAHGKGYDEAWKSFMMLALAGLYGFVLMSPSGVLKDWAGLRDFGGFPLYIVFFVSVALLLVPVLYAPFILVVKRLTRGAIPFKTLFVRYAYTLVPLGMMGWVAFSFAILLPNGSYAAMVISDPFGWGWDLFGTRDLKWTPLFTDWMPYLIAATVLAGLYWSIRTTHRISRKLLPDAAAAANATGTLALFQALLSIGLLWVYIGGAGV